MRNTSIKPCGSKVLFLLTVFGLLAAAPALAAEQVSQNPPGPPVPGQPADPNLQRIPQASPLTPAPTGPGLELPAMPETPAPAPSDAQVQITKINVVGSTVFSAEELAALTRPLEGRQVSVTDLFDLTNRITQLYQERGYSTSKALLPEQAIENGVIEIRVVEAALTDIQIEGTQNLNPSYIKDRISLAKLTPLNAQELEDQLRLLQADPLFTSVEASLRPGAAPGQTILVVTVQEAAPFVSNFNIDNYSPPAVGGERFGTRLSYNNLTGNGDALSVGYNRSFTGGSNQLDFSYRTPLNPMNGTLQLRYAPSDYRITDPSFASFGINGSSSLYDISYRQPIVRTPREELALSLSFTHQSGQSFIFNDIPMPFGVGPDANGVSRTSVFKIGQDYTLRDPSGAWAFRSQFNIGVGGLLGATQNPEPIPDSNFLSWLGQAQRVQVMGTDNLLVASVDLQLSANSLLPSEQFSIGGGQSVRGYRQNARSGDNGFRLSLEDRITVARNETGASALQIAPFVDLGAVWNSGGNPNQVPAQNLLGSVGVGLLWQATPGVSVRVDYGVPFASISDRGNNIHDQGLHFSVNARF